MAKSSPAQAKSVTSNPDGQTPHSVAFTSALQHLSAAPQESKQVWSES